MQNPVKQLNNIQIQLKITGYHHFYINRVTLLLRERLKTNLEFYQKKISE
jgi:hypothetical protein